MKNNSTIKIFTTVAIVAVCLLGILCFFPGTVYSDIAVTLATVGGGVAILYQIRKETQIAESDFVAGLNQNFNDNENFCDLFVRIQNGEEVTRDDEKTMLQYLCFFETLYVLLENGGIKIKLVDDLFRRRFFYIVTNKKVQEIQLSLPNRPYDNIFYLYKTWTDYIVKSKSSGIDDFDEDYLKHIPNAVSLKEVRNKETSENLYKLVHGDS
jgi:hypothetical protein